MDYKIKLSTPHMGGTELDYVQKAFNENWIAPVGSNILDFEKALEDYLGENSYVAALSSGTAAIHLALILAGVEKDDEVICQSLTFAASAFPILYLGAKPIFVDSEKDTWNMCPDFLEQAIISRISYRKKPKAIIVVDVFGMPAKMEEIVAVANKYNIPLIEDAAEALGSEYKGRKCGTFGDYGILSFNGNKIITTSGGGALVCRSLGAKEKAVFLATQAKDKAPHYQHSELGFNYRLSNILAGIGLGQMELLNRHVKKRREMNQFYKILFKPFSYINVFDEFSAASYSNHWLTSFVFSANKNDKNAEEMRLYLENHSIEARAIWKPLHLQPVFKDYLFFGETVAEGIFESGLCLPSGSNLNESEKKTIAKTIREYLNS